MVYKGLSILYMYMHAHMKAYTCNMCESSSPSLAPEVSRYHQSTVPPNYHTGGGGVVGGGGGREGAEKRRVGEGGGGIASGEVEEEEW